MSLCAINSSIKILKHVEGVRKLCWCASGPGGKESASVEIMYVVPATMFDTTRCLPDSGLAS